MEPLKTHAATCEAVDRATAGVPPSPGASANDPGECEAVDSATAGTPPSPGASANDPGECEAVDSATADALPSPGASANDPGECEAVDSATAGTPPCAPLYTPESARQGIVTRLDVYNAFVEKSKEIKTTGRPPDLSVDERNLIVASLLGDEIKPWERKTCNAIGSFIVKCETKYKNSSRHKKAFLKKNEDWLCKSFLNDLPKELKDEADFLFESPGSAQYEDLSERRQLRPRKRLHATLEEQPSPKFIKVETMLDSNEPGCSRDSATRSIEFIINTCIRSISENPETSTELARELLEPDQSDTLEETPQKFIKVETMLDSNEPGCSRDSATRSMEFINNTCSQNPETSTEIARELLEPDQSDTLDEPPQKCIKVETMLDSNEPGCSRDSATRSIEFIINTCSENPETSTELARKLLEPDQSYTPEEALALIIDSKLSVQSYNSIRQDLQSRQINAFPPYYKVLDYKKNCYPDEELDVTEIEALVSLQSLVDHTFQRIILNIDESINNYCEQQGLSNLECNLNASWGFDGSSGQSFYKQRLDQSRLDPSFCEKSFLATTFVPLQISSGNSVIWTNPCPTSYRFCRPIHIQYRKETRELILSEKAFIESQIKNLVQTSAVTTKSYPVTLTATHFTLCMIDGKVENIITNTNSQMRCPICRLTASKFNNLKLFFFKTRDNANLAYGIRPLHAWIRVLEFLLHLSYKNEPSVRKWVIRKASREHCIVAERKKTIREEIRKKMGLLVDVEKPNSGTTNDSNTARFALNDKNRPLFAEILGLEQWLLDDFQTILVAISCGLPVDATKFGKFCKEVASKYVSTYPWHLMTVTIHKILVHGNEIIRKSVLPVGLPSEQAAESRNKFWRSDREHHCRKLDRQKNILDLFHRALESSDPVLSSVRLKQRQNKKKKMPLSHAVLSILQPFEQVNDSNDSGEAETSEFCAEDEVHDNISDTISLSREVDIFADEETCE